MPAHAQPLPQEQIHLFGGNGVHVETGTQAVAGDFCALQVLDTANFSAFQEHGVNQSSDAMTGFDIPAGTILFNGLGIAGFTLSYGKVRAYRR